MYKIIGADQKEYGPITAEQVGKWIAEGRANGQTQAQAEGGAEWRPLSAFPEFAAALSARATVTPPPHTEKVSAEALAEKILAHGYEVRIGHCVSRGWELVKKNFGLLVGATLLVFIVELAINAIPILGIVAGPLLAGVLHGGLLGLFLKRIRGGQGGVGDAFAGFSVAFVPLMLASLVTALLTLVGFVLLIIPGIYLAVAWTFTILLVFDKGIDFWAAMELSRKVVTRNWWQVFGLLVINVLIVLAGALALLVGLLVAIPITLAAIAYAYEDIFGAEGGQGA